MRISTFTGNQDELFLVIVHFSVRRISRQIICTAYYFSGSVHSFFVSWMSNVIALLDIFHVYSFAKRILKAAWPCIDPWFFFLGRAGEQDIVPWFNYFIWKWLIGLIFVVRHGEKNPWLQDFITKAMKIRCLCLWEGELFMLD